MVKVWMASGGFFCRFSDLEWEDGTTLKWNGGASSDLDSGWMDGWIDG